MRICNKKMTQNVRWCNVKTCISDTFLWNVSFKSLGSGLILGSKSGFFLIDLSLILFLFHFTFIKTKIKNSILDKSFYQSLSKTLFILILSWSGFVPCDQLIKNIDRHQCFKSTDFYKATSSADLAKIQKRGGKSGKKKLCK